MRVLVTGARGYLGSAVVPALRQAGHEPVAFGGDVLDDAALADALAGAEGVVHLAAMARVRDAAADPERCHRVNADGTAAVLAAALAEGRRDRDRPVRVVLASTAAVYGPAAGPVHESAPHAPLGPYAESKAAAERHVDAAVLAGAGGVGAVVLRIFNAAGAAAPGRADPDGTRLIPRVVRVAAGLEERLEVYGDGGAVRDYVHVGDVAAAVRLALEGACGGTRRTFNVGATPASVLDVVAAARQVTGRDVPVVHRPGNPQEVPDSRADTGGIRSALGWRPERSALATLVAEQWDATVRGEGRAAPR